MTRRQFTKTIGATAALAAAHPRSVWSVKASPAFLPIPDLTPAPASPAAAELYRRALVLDANTLAGIGFPISDDDPAGVTKRTLYYHFPTKEKLAAAVIHRYTDEVAELMDHELARDPDPVKVWARAFRGTLHSEERMCPCTVLGAGSLDLPPEVAAEVKRFFKMCLDKLVAGGLSPTSAAKVLATITGAMVVATALGDLGAYDRATTEMIRARVPKNRSGARGRR